MSDQIVLTGLKVVGRHGVYQFERERGQEFIIDVTLELDTHKAAQTDDITETVHYGDLAERVAALVAGEPVNLLETLADRLARMCLEDERVFAVEITVHKPHAPVELDFADIAVRIRRERQQRMHPKFRRVGAPSLVSVPGGEGVDGDDGAAVA